MLMWFIFVSKKEKGNLFSFIIQRIFSHVSSLTSSFHMWLSVICNKSDHLHITTSWDLCFGFVFNIFKVMTQCLVQDTHIIFTWLNHWQCLSCFWVKIYFISHLHIYSGQDTSLVNAVNIYKKNKFSSLIKMMLQSELLSREQVLFKY